MNMRCRSPEQHKSRGTANSYTGNSTSASLRATSSPSSSSVCRRGREGQGALWFPVLWVILPHPAPVVPCVCSMCCGLSLPHPPVPPFAKARGLVGGRGIPWGTSTVTWMTCACLLSAGAGGGIPWRGGGACDAATRHHIYIYIYGSPPPRYLPLAGFSCSPGRNLYVVVAPGGG